MYGHYKYPIIIIMMHVYLVHRLDNTVTLRCFDLRIAIGRLKSLPSHNALILLRSSFSAFKVMHTLRIAPCSGHPLLYEFDNLLREGISAITNSFLSALQWPGKPSNQRGRSGDSWCFIAGSFPPFWLLLRARRFSRTCSCHRPRRFLIIWLCLVVQVGPNYIRLFAPQKMLLLNSALGTLQQSLAIGIVYGATRHVIWIRLDPWP